MIHTRRAGPLDARPMAELLNAIIAKGGTTALTDPVTSGDLRGWMATPGAIWTVAEGDDGALMGFQWVEPLPDLPPDTVSIATFSRVGQTGLGIGSALFVATVEASKRAGFRWISAEIRDDNIGGLTYYKSRGFEEVGRKAGIRLGNGLIVGKVLTRYEL